VLLGLAAIVYALIIITGSPRQGISWLNDGAAVGEWTRGNLSAAITLVEYSDFQCPSCARYHSYVKRLMEEAGDRLQYTFRHYPLERHGNAELSAVCAEAAGRQGKFWQMQDRLFDHQKEWADLGPQLAQELFTQYASLLDLDTTAFAQDLRSEALLEKVREDYRSGERSGVRATPSFFLNGKRISRMPRNYKDFRGRVLQHERDPH